MHAANTTARIHSRDLLDIATLIGEVEITLKFCVRGLTQAWERDIDQPGAKRVALATLRRVSLDIDQLVTELQELPL